MISFMYLTLLIIHHSAIQAAQVPSTDENICIVGAGIAGASCSHFIREFNKQVRLDLFEKSNTVGGRIASMHSVTHDKQIEAGGSIFHNDNRYMADLATKMNLTVLMAGESGKRMGIFNGESFVYESTGWKWIDMVNMFWRYGRDLLKLDSFVTELMQKYDRIYEKQKQNVFYTSPADLLKDVGLYELTQVTLEEALREKGIGPLLINELAAAINRVNYGQNTTLNAFAGAVGLAGSGRKLRQIKEGNKQLVDRLLGNTKVHLHDNSDVMSIDKSSGGYSLRLRSNEKYDCAAVVIATPWELSNIALPDDLTGTLIKDREFQLTETTFVEGELRPAYFNSSGDVPEIILTTESPELPFSSIGLQVAASGKKNLYKVFSREKLSRESLNKMFSSPKIVDIFPWKAYPKFRPPEFFSDFELSDGLLYINAIETSASALEMSAVGAKNVAIALRKKFGWESRASSHDEL